MAKSHCPLSGLFCFIIAMLIQIRINQLALHLSSPLLHPPSILTRPVQRSANATGNNLELQLELELQLHWVHIKCTPSREEVGIDKQRQITWPKRESIMQSQRATAKEKLHNSLVLF